jgi:hypothetical protein
MLKNKLKEKNILHKVKNKLMCNNAVITKADKGNAVIILHSNEYNVEINNFVEGMSVS